MCIYTNIQTNHLGLDNLCWDSSLEETDSPSLGRQLSVSAHLSVGTCRICSVYIVALATVVIILVLCRRPYCESLCVGIAVIHKRCYVTADFLLGLLAFTIFLPHLCKDPLVLGVGLMLLQVYQMGLGTTQSCILFIFKSYESLSLSPSTANRSVFDDG